METEQKDDFANQRRQAKVQLDKLGSLALKTTIPMTQKSDYVEGVFSVLGIYRSKLDKALEKGQFSDIIEAAKNDLRNVANKHRA